MNWISTFSIENMLANVAYTTLFVVHLLVSMICLSEDISWFKFCIFFIFFYRKKIGLGNIHIIRIFPFQFINLNFICHIPQEVKLE